MSVLGKYIRTYGGPYRLRRKNGKGVVELRFNDGYVTVYSRQPGTPRFTQEIHISRSAWLSLIESSQLETATEAMTGPDFDCYRAERRMARDEAQHLSDQRELKRQLYGRRRKRRRRT